MKIVYFGNDLFSNCLLLLIKNRLNIERVFINDVQGNASFIKRICRKYNIVYSTEKPSIVTLKGYLNDEQTVFVVADYGYKVPTNEIKYAINIHPSLLPKSRGPTPLTYIIDNPENAGVSIHKLTEKLDAGSILIQEKFEVENNETISSLMVKSQLLAETLLEELLNNFNELYNNADPQLEKLASFQSLPPVKRRFVNWDQNTVTVR
ncbi:MULTISPECIES: formyltransferase family protein [unclassified Alteromonas]|uniref:formyltransferase family protein n=1 Tax=unclassified Alteromonas TaxID=2614992 RepID=UPI001EF32543|nr:MULTISPECIES: formyltransferase family protein [unclassified Alteromonas]MCG7639889.1 methionyl-tRNA formyltransferase [Alteromonas sp. CNT1-28]MCG7815223.1 methionyl-tRNA formyltransferase [Alteromonas sp. MCA-1]